MNEHCPGSRQPVALRDTRGKAWCGHCCCWYRACKDGTVRTHPRPAGRPGGAG